MKAKPVSIALILFAFLILLGLPGCDQDSIVIKESPPLPAHQRLDIGWGEILKHGRFDVKVSPRSHGYLAEARGKGTIPSGEYAGRPYQIEVKATYSGIGFETLIEGSASVSIKNERFISVSNPFIQSFCCGEGYLQMIDGQYVFTVFGQVNHSTASDPHNHLFAALACTWGEMHMNIANQSGTGVIQTIPPHNPGVGLITNIDPIYIEVLEH